MFVRLRGENMFFTAEEARGLALAWQEELHKAELTKVESAIQSAIEQGQFQVEIANSISSVVQERLRKLGYHIENGQHNNDIFTIIKW